MEEASAKPMCPRCGYDLAGLIATWLQSCPLGAQCSECGLEFDCGRALSPRLLGPAWSYEHGFARSARRFWATSARTLVPRRLFRDLAVDHRVNAGRLLRLAALWVAFVHIATTALSVVCVALSAGTFGFLLEVRFWQDECSRVLFPYGADLWIPTGRMTSSHVPLAPLFMLVCIPTFLMPAWLLILSSSMATARVRRVHLLRGAAYSLPCAAVYVVVVVGSITIGPMVEWFAGVLVPKELVLAAVLAGFAHHLNWWFVFIRRYLRLRHALATVILFTVMNILVLMITFIVADLMGARW